ncbi:Hypothetical predicted protein [Podarcis lilfordi]|uniref:Uncharacterized protein n=1 Tax=Podarcis lilfordi TaxID=74358 RepID=A0AA35KW06_9SAUR|nr:Hypothetical predicted protein [Podarcis lilfordi]
MTRLTQAANRNLGEGDDFSHWFKRGKEKKSITCPPLPSGCARKRLRNKTERQAICSAPVLLWKYNFIWRMTVDLHIYTS